MLIFNREEVENSYLTSDNEIVKIDSRISNLRSFVEKYQKGELLPEDYEIHVFRSGVNPVKVYVNDHMSGSFDARLYTHTYNPEEEGGLDTMEQGSRAELYAEFERYTYGQNHDFLEVPIEELSHEVVLHGFYDALGINPNLYSLCQEGTLSLKEAQDMSYEGRGLYRAWESLNDSNRFPTAEDLKVYHALSPYEKQVLTDSMLNPTTFLDMLHALKADSGLKNTIISQSSFQEYVSAIREKVLLEEHATTKETAMDIQQSVIKDIFGINAEYERVKEVKESDSTSPTLMTRMVLAAENAFTQSKHRRAPRVLPELVKAIVEAYHVDTEEKFREACEAIGLTDKFNLNNFKKEAQSHSPGLYLLSYHLNFDTVKKEHLQIFASFVSPSVYKQMIDKDFFLWYEKYKNELKPSDLVTILKRIDSLQFALDRNPKLTIMQARQARGIANAALVKYQYHIDFSKAEVAIPNRGLIVEDKQAKIKMYILNKDDTRVFTVGQDTHCCQNLAIAGDQTYGDYHDSPLSRHLLEQHFATYEDACTYVEHNAEELERICGSKYFITPGAGGSCVANELTNPLCWVTIWEDTVSGDTLAQADTHYDPVTNTLIYDNIEFANDGNVNKFKDIIATYAKESTFDNIHIGTGYCYGMKSFGKRIATTEMVQYSRDVSQVYKEAFGDRVYSDYNSNAVKIKKNGEMLVFSKKKDSSFHIERLPEDNSMFQYLLHPIASHFIDYTSEEKKDLITRYEEQNLTAQELLKLAEDPKLLKDYEILPIEVQRKILTDKEGEIDTRNIHCIKHPDSLLINTLVEADPASIIYFDEYNTTPEIWEQVVQKDGSLVEYCPRAFRNENILTLAVKNNPYSVKYVADSLEDSPFKEKLIRLAVFAKPILLAQFPDLPEYVWVNICEKPGKGKFGKFCPHQTYKVQKAMITSSPYNIDFIREPLPQIVKEAAEQIHSIRTNPKYVSYFQAAYKPSHTTNTIERATPQEISSIPAHTPIKAEKEEDLLFSEEVELDFA